MKKIDEKEFCRGLSVNRRKKYIQQMPEYLFNQYGKLVNGTPFDMNWIAQSLNESVKDKARGYSGGEIKAIITITEMAAEVINNYCQAKDRDVIEELTQFLESSIGNEDFQTSLEDYSSKFLRMKRNPQDMQYKKLVTQDIILNWLNNINPAFKPYNPLFDNSTILQNTGMMLFIQEAVSFLESSSKQDSNEFIDGSLYHLLREPAVRYSQSIIDQLEFIIEYWRVYLDDTDELLSVLDVLKEEQVRFTGFPETMPPVDYKGLANEEAEEYYSLDKDWMPSLVLIAKSTYVWLSQLSMKYGRMIRKLNEIPSEELQIMADRGITGLWLIGIWQRSYASQKIKRMNGQHHVIASAYSLDSYRISEDLGGESAWEELSRNAARFGIRMGCDMVPNHTGIDSQWVLHHPDWFIQRDDMPYPNYSFNGENLSSHPEIEVRIEDHYYAKTDAAVVFELNDRRDGRKRYIYHGNDGTGLPWNDTAQLDYTLKEVREAVINEIIAIAKKIPIIRFDAAMTLAKKHYQRLWFPKPGSGGDIPTRSQYALSQQEFESVFPREFWRDVVDKINTEAPDTLLLAEAFWMMEGYFVRNLGMHRVYNSAFMHMMMREDNAAFKKTIYNTIEFDKRILKRYVNFMSNPDEETAIGQFGNDDKYFGVCTLMITLPGLPMFGHGQIEGFKEKYGMEYAAPQLEEREDKYLVNRHKREIFPLLKMRRVFAEADNFRLYDFYDNDGNLNDNVIAYSNFNHGVHSLVIYNNSYEQTWGKIKSATDFRVTESGLRVVESIDWGAIVGLSYGPFKYLLYRDLVSGNEFLRLSDNVLNSGLEIYLKGYGCYVISEIRLEEDDEEGKLRTIHERIGINGVDSLENMKKLIYLKPLHDKLKALFTPAMIKNQNLLINGELTNANERKFFLENAMFPAIFAFHDAFMETAGLAEWSQERLIDNTLAFFKGAEMAIIRNKPATGIIPPGCIIAIWTLLREIRKRIDENQMDLHEVIDKYMLAEPLNDIFEERCGDFGSRLCLDLIYSSLELEDFWEEILKNNFRVTADKLMQNSNIFKLIRVNEYKGTRWLHKESFELVVGSLEIIIRISRCDGRRYGIIKDLNAIGDFFNKLLLLSEKAGYNYDKMLEYIDNEVIEED